MLQLIVNCRDCFAFCFAIDYRFTESRTKDSFFESRWGHFSFTQRLVRRINRQNTESVADVFITGCAAIGYFRSPAATDHAARRPQPFPKSPRMRSACRDMGAVCTEWPSRTPAFSDVWSLRWLASRSYRALTGRRNATAGGHFSAATIEMVNKTRICRQVRHGELS